MAEAPFIAIEGPIGIGKTSLARKLAAHFNWHILQEIVEENPFLGKFYDNIDAWSFQTEMFFLCNRFMQLEAVKDNYLSENDAVIADYHIFKNMIFARHTLPTDKLLKYGQIYNILTKDLPMPNMVIYLHGSLDTLLHRIRMRGREVEQNINSGYLEQLAKDYATYMDAFAQSHPDIPVIPINGDTHDFIQDQQDLQSIIEHVQSHIEARHLLEGNK